MDNKPWYWSKTILTGIAEEVIGAVLTIKEAVVAGEAEPTGIALIVVGTLQIILRLVTKQPIGNGQ